MSASPRDAYRVTGRAMSPPVLSGAQAARLGRPAERVKVLASGAADAAVAGGPDDDVDDGADRQRRAVEHQVVMPRRPRVAAVEVPHVGLAAAVVDLHLAADVVPRAPRPGHR